MSLSPSLSSQAAAGALIPFVKTRIYEGSFAEKILNIRKLKQRVITAPADITSENIFNLFQEAFAAFMIVDTAEVRAMNSDRGPGVVVGGRMHFDWQDKILTMLTVQEVQAENGILLMKLAHAQAEIAALEAERHANSLL